MLQVYKKSLRVLRIRISKKNRQHKQRKKYKGTNNDPQNMHVKLKIELHEPHLKPGVNSGAPDG